MVDGEAPVSSSTVTQGHRLQLQAAGDADASVYHNDESVGRITVLQSGEPVLPLLEELLPLMWWSVDWVL